MSERYDSTSETTNPELLDTFQLASMSRWDWLFANQSRLFSTGRLVKTKPIKSTRSE
jgi:hypothetical protein